MRYISFNLDIEDGWPPVSKECFPCLEVEGGYRIQNSPLFAKGISVGDVIGADLEEEGTVVSWHHVKKSGNSTIWLLETKRGTIGPIIDGLHRLGCSTSKLEQWHLYSVDVPETCDIELVDQCIAKADEESVAVAYPSFRHVDIQSC